MKVYIAIISISLLLGCTPKEDKESLTQEGMKCGAGKCGASMVDGSTLLVKKKLNILSQLRAEDSRRDCVLKATDSKILYDCVRDKKTNRLTLKPFSAKEDVIPKKEIPVMKCEVGKCGGK